MFLSTAWVLEGGRSFARKPTRSSTALVKEHEHVRVSVPSHPLTSHSTRTMSLRLFTCHNTAFRVNSTRDSVWLIAVVVAWTLWAIANSYRCSPMWIDGSASITSSINSVSIVPSTRGRPRGPEVCGSVTWLNRCRLEAATL